MNVTLTDRAPSDGATARAEETSFGVRSSWTEWAVPLTFLVAGLALYISTLAPTVVWGDDATLQIAAVEGKLQASAGSHPAWVAMAHAFTRLPLGETAYRVNLVSAVCAALALMLIYRIQRVLTISAVAAILATAAFAVSHTFWAHAVRPEVYTMTIATSAAVVLCALEWQRRCNDWLLGLTGLAFGLALATHVLVLLYVPAIAWLFFTQRAKLSARGVVSLLIGAAGGLAPLALLLARDSRTYGMDSGELLRWALLTYAGYDFSEQVLRFSAAALPGDVAQWGLFLGYQFVGLALVLAAVGFLVGWRRLPRWQAVFVALLYAVPALFAFSYRVGDRFVFYLPSYVAVTIWVGLGVERLLRALARLSRSAVGHALLIAALLAVMVAGPVIIYRVTPDAMDRLDIRFRADRRVPGPNGRYFLLWPPKAGYYDARDFATSALAKTPQGGLMLADPILASPMQYLQQVEGVRPDVKIAFCCWDIAAVLMAESGRPAVLADLTAGIYPVEQLRQEYDIIEENPIYLLTPRHTEPEGAPD